jgi:hypothetical protein
VIRTVAFGIVCLAGLGAIAAAAKKSPPPRPAEIGFPVTAGNKADRLPISSNRETTTQVEKLNVVYIPPTEEHRSFRLNRCREHQKKQNLRRLLTSLTAIGTIRTI